MQSLKKTFLPLPFATNVALGGNYSISSRMSEQDMMYTGYPSSLPQQQMQLTYVRKLAKVSS